MKLLFSLPLQFFLLYTATAQNVGIGTTTPKQALDVNGAIKIGTGALNEIGSIRYNSGKFEGGDGSSWKTFDNIPAGTIVLSSTYPNTNLQSSGFSFLSKLKGEISTPFAQSAAANSWQPASSGISGRSESQSVWTGSNVILWGGSVSGVSVNDGALYDPVSDTWEVISTVGAPSPRSANVIIWTGTEMIVWGGYSYDGSYTYYNSGAKFNPATNTWTTMSTTGALTGRQGCAYGWTGTELVIWGGGNASGALTDGARYNPATNTWTAISSTGNPGQRYGYGHSYSSTDLFIWGGYYGSTLIANGYQYNFSTDTWSELPVTGTSPEGKNGPIVKWIDNKLVVWGGGSADLNTHYNTGSFYNPVTASWKPMLNSTTTDFGKKGVVYNNKLYVWGIGGGQYYDVTGNNWSDYPAAIFLRTNRNSPALCATNFGFLCWGGQEYGGSGDNLPFFEDGERFFVDANAAITVNTKGAQLFYLYIKN